MSNPTPTGESVNVHIEHYFPKGYNPDDEPWKSIRKHHNAALATERSLSRMLTDSVDQMRKDLAAERERGYQAMLDEREKVTALSDQLAVAVEALKVVSGMIGKSNQAEILQVIDAALAKIKENK